MFREYFFELRDLVPESICYLKLEGLQATGSIKIKPALFMIDDLERRGLAIPGETTIIESSSGNLGVALSMICRIRNYNFICVTDPNIAPSNKCTIEAYGGKVLMVDKRDVNGGFLESRINFIKQLLAENPAYIWLNQYANPANKRAHADWTAMEILKNFPYPDYLFVGSGTTGTLMGLVERFREKSPSTKIIAVEPAGSVTFDKTQKARRLIPGIGTSRTPELANPSQLFDIVYVKEEDTIKFCHMMAKKYGLLLGGSSGSVIAAISAYADRLEKNSQIVTISPDFGDRYLDTIYSPQWVETHFGEGLLYEDNNGSHNPAQMAGPLREVIEKPF